MSSTPVQKKWCGCEFKESLPICTLFKEGKSMLKRLTGLLSPAVFSTRLNPFTLTYSGSDIKIHCRLKRHARPFGILFHSCFVSAASKGRWEAVVECDIWNHFSWFSDFTFPEERKCYAGCSLKIVNRWLNITRTTGLKLASRHQELSVAVAWTGGEKVLFVFQLGPLSLQQWLAITGPSGCTAQIIAAWSLIDDTTPAKPEHVCEHARMCVKSTNQTPKGSRKMWISMFIQCFV